MAIDMAHYRNDLYRRAYIGTHYHNNTFVYLLQSFEYAHYTLNIMFILLLTYLIVALIYFIL